MKPLILIILGTAREGRQSEYVARYIFETLKNRPDMDVELVDAKEWTHGHTIPPWENNPATQTWRDLVGKASGFIIVTPEYNHGYPGELKLLLDSGPEDYGGHPVGLVGVSSGAFGGTRVVEQLLPIMRELGLVALSLSLYFPKVKDFVKLDQAQKDEQYKERVGKLGDALLKEKYDL